MNRNIRDQDEFPLGDKLLEMKAELIGKSPLPITVIGLGPMGLALAGAFLNSGHHTTVWNRTAEKADQLVEQGAVLSATAADAITASPVVIVCVIDYEAVSSILDPEAAVLKGRILVNLTADSPDRSR